MLIAAHQLFVPFLYADTQLCKAKKKNCSTLYLVSYVGRVCVGGDFLPLPPLPATDKGAIPPAYQLQLSGKQTLSLGCTVELTLLAWLP